MQYFTLKSKYFYFLCALLFSINFGFSQSSIIISQYIETNSGTTPKGIEVFNVSGVDITFSAGNTLQVYQGSNGGSCTSIVTINSGTLAANEVWVIGTSDLTSYATSNGTDLSGTETFAFNFNGDDALQLYLGGVLQDAFGTCGSDPGSSWIGGSADTKNNNLQIKDGFCNGDNDGWTDPSVRFDEIADGSTMTGFGNAPAPCTTATGCTEIFISEYIEGSGNNKFIELYNPTNTSITLTGTYAIEIYANGSTSATTISLIGSIAAYGVFILENSSETLGVTANQSSGLLTFNGDDAIVLTKSSTLIDVIGQIGYDPGSQWSGASCGTANETLVRNSSINIGDDNGADTFDPDTEWTCYGIDDVSNLGSHTSMCSVGCSHTIVSITPASGPISTTVTITGTGFTASSTVAFNGTAATVTFVNSTTLTATVPAGATTGVITITESGCDVDSATDYTVTTCSPTQTITSFAPTSGPVLTEVTITGTGFSGSTTVSFNGTAASIVSQTATQIIAEVPTGATTGVITVTETGCPFDSSTDFTVLTDNGCTGGSDTGFSDLLFSGIYDETSGSCHYIELYNPTSSAIDLSGYSIGSSNNQTLPNDLPATYNGGTYPLSGIIQPQSTFLILATSETENCESCTNVVLDLEFLSSSLGYNGYTTGPGGYDKLVLLNGVTPVDLWSNGNAYDDGYIYTRITSATAPALIFNSADWSGSTTPDCFAFAISTTPLPTVDTQPADNTSCSGYAFSVAASPGNGGTLTYQWRYNNGSAAGWTNVTSGSFSPGIVTGQTSTDLEISGFNLDGYQFYCAVFENGACASFSNAAQIKVATTTWDGSAWSNGTPDIDTVVVIDGNYSTATNGSFSACQLFLNTSKTLTIDNLTYVEVQNDATINGHLLVETQGSFVQNSDTSNFNLNAGGTAIVNKSTTVLTQWYDYTYWSSPITNETVGAGLDIAPANRRYWFNASNYLDITAETGNNNATVAGHDDIDDNGDDWQIASGSSIMTPGLGYAATVSPTGFVAGAYQVTFEGKFNNGIITTPISYNGDNGDNDWNFIGNPYASAIDTNTFFSENPSVIGGALYLWSQSIPPSSTTNGNEVQNFAQADYATITQSGVNVAGGSGITPTNHIPSCQGFFVQGLSSGNVTFNNSMRKADTSSNTQFFRSATTTDEKEAVWLNLTSNNGVFSQIAIAYLDDATNGNDGAGYDATRNLSSGVAAATYSLMDGNDLKFAVQGKARSSLTDDEIVPIGFVSTISVPTTYTFSIAQLSGNSMVNADIFIKDKLLNVEHNLTTEYTFTSDTGEFNDRFEIAFMSVNALSVTTPIYDNNLTVYQKGNGLEISTSNQSTISNIKIFDVLGRLLYNVNNKNNLSKITINTQGQESSVLFLNATLSDGNVITKKIIYN